jgi:hypothetical protein
MSRRSSEYQVGYGRPPQHTRFPKGEHLAPRDERKGHHQRGLKQPANKAASGDKRAIQDMLRFQTMLFPDAPMTNSEPANSKHPPPPDADPAKVALAIPHILRAADATRESESAG